MPRKGHSTSSVETTTTPSFPLEDVTSEHGARGEPYSRYTAPRTLLSRVARHTVRT
jgi:hypothetical protein